MASLISNVTLIWFVLTSYAVSFFHKTSCQLGVQVQDDARRVSREHRDVVTSNIVFD